MPVRSYDAKINGMASDFFDFPNKDYVAKDLIEAFGCLEKVTVTVKSRRKPRSLPQNGLMHAYFQIIADESGNTLEKVKSCLKRLFLTRDMLDKDGEVMYNPKTGEPLTYVQDTSDLSTIEAMTFTEEIRVWALDFNIYLPLPDEQVPLNFKEQ